MTSAQVLDLKGNKVREVGLEDEVFGVTPNVGLLHSALVRQLANGRSGAANTKTRSEVRGGGRKPWRQKGTGRARAGSIRSPLWEGGGVTFGPRPRDFSQSMPKKQRALALKSALAAKKDNLVVVQNFASITDGKTKQVATALKDLKLYGQKILLVLDHVNDEDKRVQLAARNIDGLKVIHVSNLNVKDLLESEVVLTTESAIQTIHNRFKPTDKDAAGAEKKAKKATTAEKAPAKEAKPAKAKADEAPAKKPAAKPKKES
ncbi:MAG: 50S ribosomal protein L4 [Candidatus Melainabacteria bacterium]|nr:50S ribosomal protein L4 [Candidatus Melainabacteria bacterium]